MGRRRKPHSSAPRHEQPGDPPPPSKPPITAVESLHPVIICKVKTSRTLLFRRKRHHEALGFIQDSISCYPNWGHLRLVEACIHKHMVDHVAKDCVEKIKHLSRGAVSARSAAELLNNLALDECKDDRVLPYSNDILSWLYVGLKINEDLNQWKAVREFERGASEMVFRIFVEECSHLAKVCERISEISSKVGVVEAVYTKCLEEIKKMKKNPDLFDLLRKRQIVLQGDHDDIASRIESEIISDLLKDASAAELLVSMSSSGLRTQEHVRKIDNYIRKALKTLKLQLLEDLAFLDAIVLRSLGDIHRYELVLEKTSFYDYRSIIVPLLKSWLKRKLQYPIYKDATQKKSDAACKRRDQ